MQAGKYDGRWTEIMTKRAKIIWILAVVMVLCSVLSGCDLLEEGMELLESISNSMAGQNGNAPALPQSNSGSEQKVDPKQAEEKLEEMLESLVDGEKNDNVQVMAENDSVTTLSGSGDLGSDMLGEVDYKVLSITETKDGAAAELEIVSPDVSTMMDMVLEDMESFDAKRFLESMEELVDSGDYPKKTYRVSVGLKYHEGKLVIVSNKDFANAMTGGLYDARTANEAQLSEAIAEEGE